MNKKILVLTISLIVIGLITVFFAFGYNISSVKAQAGNRLVVELTANGSNINAGDPVELIYTTSNATFCETKSSPSYSAWNGRSDNGTGKVLLNTSNQIFNISSLSATTEFTLYCYKDSVANQADARVNITVNSQPANAPLVNLSASPTSINSGGTTVLSWTTNRVSSCTKTIQSSPIPVNQWSRQALPISAGSQSITLNNIGRYIFRLDCIGSNGDRVDRTATVDVSIVPSPTTGRQVDVIIRWKDFGTDQEVKYTEYLAPLK